MCFYCNRVDAVSEQQHNLDSRERFSGKVSKLGCILVFTYVSLLHEFWVRWVMLFCFHISHGAWLFHPLLLSLYVKGLWIWTVFFDIIGFFLADNFDISTLIFHWHRDNFFRGGWWWTICTSTAVTHSAAPRVPLFCSYHILTSSVICYWTDAREHGIYLSWLQSWHIPFQCY